MRRWGRIPGESMWLADDLLPNCEGGVVEGEMSGDGMRAVLTREEDLVGSVV